MNCREFVDFLIDYLEESLPPGQRAAFAGHLRDCPGCVAYLETYRQAVRLGKLACRPDDPPPAEVPEELVRAILAARDGE